MEFDNKKILVVGFGKSGISTARYLNSRGAEVTLGDIKQEADLDQNMLNEARDSGINLETGGHRIETFVNSDMIIVSPGVPLGIKPLSEARDAGIPVYGELETASRLIDTPILAVTGTNGKTTTVSLLGEIIKRSGLDLFTGGNIGTPLMDYVSGGGNADYVLVEVSSFQLDTIETFNPYVSLILNITPDHLDRYENYDAYVRSKLRITQNQGEGRYAVINDDDPILHNFEPGKGVSTLRYGFKKAKGLNAWVEGDSLIAGLPWETEYSFNLEGFLLPGRHNIENLMGAVLAALCIGIKQDIIQAEIINFKGLPHRLEHVARKGGADFYNDSKATNVDAAVKSVSAFERPVILIAGGIHKGGEYDPLVEASRSRVKKGIFIGEARHRLGDAFGDLIAWEFAAGMKEAVEKAFLAAGQDDVILLAPACSSFDMFDDYSHRGRVYKEAIEGLENG